jgi:hypothetical protein
MPRSHARTDTPETVPRLPFDATPISEIPIPEAALTDSDRMTLVLSAYHEQLGKPATQFPASCSRMLDREEQACLRHTTVGSEWVPLDTGWLADQHVGQIIVQNRTGETLRGRDTGDLETAIVEIVIGPPISSLAPTEYIEFREPLIVRPFGGISVFESRPGTIQMVRCIGQHEDGSGLAAEISVFAIPR